MGISPSSLLDETKSNYIRDQAEVELKDFSPYYRKQFAVAHFCQVEDDLEHHEEKNTQLLKQRPAPEEGEVLYEEGLLYFDETRKWRDRYVVVRANYCLECHESLETFIKGVPPLQKLLPTGGTVLTTEEKYMTMVDKCFPDDSSLEDFAPPLAAMPGQFPVYLRLPYRRDSYFCFRQQHKQEAFISILSDCIRHQNQDYLKKGTCEVQAFLKAVQLYRQDRGRYDAWDMLIGSDVRVMGNLVMEQMLPSLEKEMLPCLKAKKTEKKRVWFATVEAAYILAQEHLLGRMSALKEECRALAFQQEILIHSDMDQILKARGQLEDKVRAKVSEPAEQLCSESIQPFLGSVLEELMEPISAGFQEGRQLSGVLMDEVCQDVLPRGNSEELKKVLSNMARPNLQRCYQMMDSLQDKPQHLLDRFSFSSTTAVIQSAQIDLQELMENAAYTFEQLIHKAFEDDPDSADSAINKAKHRVLKQFDYDSSTVRKRICREALISIALPFIKKNLAPTCKSELQGLGQSIDADHSNFIHVENIYESILLQTLDKEVSKVVKEAANLKKFNLFADSRDLLSQSSCSSVSSPSVSTPSTPTTAPTVTNNASMGLQPRSPLAVDGMLCSSPSEELEETASLLQKETLIETPPGGVEQKDAGQDAAGVQEAMVGIQTVKEGGAPTSPQAEPPSQNDSRGRNALVAAEDLIQLCPPQSMAAPAEVGMKTGADPPGPGSGPPNRAGNTSAGGTGSQTGATTEDRIVCESSGTKVESPSSGGTPEDISLALKQEEHASVSDPDSLHVSVGSETSHSDLESTPEDMKGDERATTSDLLEDEANINSSPRSSGCSAQETTEPDPQAQVDAVSPPSEEVVPTSEPTNEEMASSPKTQSPDSFRESHHLVEEVIEVEELLQRNPSGIPKEE